MLYGREPLEHLPPTARLLSAEIAQRAATMCHLGAISAKVGRPVRYDPDKEAITGDPEASAMVMRKLRAPWNLG